MRSILVLVALLYATPVFAQRPVWVFLEPGANAAVLTKKIEKSGARIRVHSKWLHAVSVDATDAQIGRIARLKDVRGIDDVARMVTARRTADRSTASRPIAEFDSSFYGPNWRLIKLLGIPSSHTLNITGKNIRIAILDTGFDPLHESLSTRRIIAQKDFINNDFNVANQGTEGIDPNNDPEAHGTRVWSLLGGYKPGRIVGPAFDAQFILAKVDVDQREDSVHEDFAADEDRWVAGVEWADSMGARIISSSLVYRNFTDKPDYPFSAMNGRTARSTIIADEAARRGILVVSAIGNDGPAEQTLWAPADADSIIAVGSVDDNGNASSFSSRGPTADGRLKPELVAPGRNIVAAASIDPNSYTAGLAGTSYSTPFIAGGAAMFMEAWPNLTITAVKNALLLSANRAEFPDNNVGYGVPNISGAILFPEGLALGITGVNLKNELTTIQPTFTWSAPLINARMRPVRYTLEIATEPNFISVLYRDTISEQFSLTLKRPLRPGVAYYMRVIGEAFPDIRRTTRFVPPFSMPDWVRLLTFNDNNSTSTDSLQPTFRWEALGAPPPSGPLSFDFQLLNAQTETPVLTIPNLSSASVRPPGSLTPNVAYKWRVIARSPTGVVDTVTSKVIFVITSGSKPPATLLFQNFPNPFPRPDLGETTTRVWFDVNTETTVELAVYDLRGRLVRRLIPSQPTCGTVTLQPGSYGRSPAEADPCVGTTWDARDAGGHPVPRGVYILRLRAGGRDQIKRILYMPR